VERLAVLRGADQRAGRAPRRCVKTGVPTDGAVRVAAVDLRRAELAQLVVGFAVTRLLAAVRRRRVFVAVVAVSPEWWKRWRRALLLPVVVAAIGLAFVFVGAVDGAVPAIVIGVLILLAAGAWRARVAKLLWFGARYRPERDEIVIARASTGFDEDARRLYVRAIGQP
jgi:hypothetical protein